MPSEIYLVKVGMTMTEGTVEEWYANDGDQVSIGDLLYRLETEKVNMDVEAETSGTVKHIVEAGTELEPGDVVGWIFAPDEEIPDVLPTPTANPNIASVDDNVVLDTPQKPESPAPAGERVRASPAARRLARERGIDLASIDGSGPGGRIVEADVENFKQLEERVNASPAARQLANELGVILSKVDGTGPRGRITKEDVQRESEETPDRATESTEVLQMTGMRRTIAQRMFDSLRTTAQLTMDREVNVDALVQLRQELNESSSDRGVHLTYTDFIVSAVARTLKSHERMNAAWVGDEIQLNSSVNVGIAVALDEGLIVPVIHSAESKSLQEISVEAAELAKKARASELGLQEVSDGTFTVTSLGMFGVDTFTPILNAPQTGILGVGRIYDGVKWEGDSPQKASFLRLSLTWDHRVIDGAPAAEFLRNVSELLESPSKLLE